MTDQNDPYQGSGLALVGSDGGNRNISQGNQSQRLQNILEYCGSDILSQRITPPSERNLRNSIRVTRHLTVSTCHTLVFFYCVRITNTVLSAGVVATHTQELLSLNLSQDTG
jgi:hypothetical protein